MNRTYTNPSNPYITFDPERVWPPYVETLIRAGIAKRHSNDANMLKLIEFHL
jgi:centromere protein K